MTVVSRPTGVLSTDVFHFSQHIVLLCQKANTCLLFRSKDCDLFIQSVTFVKIM